MAHNNDSASIEYEEDGRPIKVYPNSPDEAFELLGRLTLGNYKFARDFLDNSQRNWKQFQEDFKGYFGSDQEMREAFEFLCENAQDTLLEANHQQEIASAAATKAKAEFENKEAEREQKEWETMERPPLVGQESRSPGDPPSRRKVEPGEVRARSRPNRDQSTPNPGLLPPNKIELSDKERFQEFAKKFPNAAYGRPPQEASPPSIKNPNQRTFLFGTSEKAPDSWQDHAEIDRPPGAQVADALERNTAGFDSSQTNDISVAADEPDLLYRDKKPKNASLDVKQDQDINVGNLDQSRSTKKKADPSSKKTVPSWKKADRSSAAEMVLDKANNALDEVVNGTNSVTVTYGVDKGIPWFIARRPDGSIVPPERGFNQSGNAYESAQEILSQWADIEMKPSAKYVK